MNAWVHGLCNQNTVWGNSSKSSLCSLMKHAVMQLARWRYLSCPGTPNKTVPCLHFAFPCYRLFLNLCCFVGVYLEREKGKEGDGKYSPYSWSWEKLQVFCAVQYFPTSQTFSWEPNLWPALQAMKVQGYEKEKALRENWLASDWDLTHWHGENTQDLKQDVFS